MELSYLERLTLRLTAGAAYLPQATIDRHAKYILGLQQQDGGWSGREGGSDLYYTSFALRSLAVMGLLEGPVAERAADFLSRQTQAPHAFVDILSLVYGGRLIEASCGLDPFANSSKGWERRLEELFVNLRRSDGGFAKTVQGQAGSTYQTFLIAIGLELLGRPLPASDPAIGFILSQRQSDGGFLEVRVAKRSGTNPTAAAIGALQTLGRLDEEVVQSAVEFLLDQQTDNGGFAANTRMPLPDLLSTFTASLSLFDLNSATEIDIEAALKYVYSMEREEGGFAGFELDPAQDIEYTFYGLGALSLLAVPKTP